MTIEMGGVTIDSVDPERLAEFWTKALGAEISANYEGFYVMLALPGDKPFVAFQLVPEPRTGKNRVHLDFTTEDRVGEVRRLVALGATEVAEHTVPGLTWTVLQDPEGNEFCVGSQHT